MDAKQWNEFCKVFNLDVTVSVKKQVTRNDIIQTLMNEGEFFFKGAGGRYTQIGLSHKESLMSLKDIKVLESIIWNPIKKYLLKKEEVKVPKNKQSGKKNAKS